ncbi:hypothetical protein LINPERPRIM_LOCUS15222, partial [Linum perenne]
QKRRLNIFHLQQPRRELQRPNLPPIKKLVSRERVLLRIGAEIKSEIFILEGRKLLGRLGRPWPLFPVKSISILTHDGEILKAAVELSHARRAGGSAEREVAEAARRSRSAEEGEWPGVVEVETHASSWG